MTARRGFTLVEVLVVMAIMIILFAMLFVPISSSIDMTRAGQSRVQMQQQLRMAMQRINRGLANATYIYLPEYIPLAGVDDTPLTPDDEYLINYSNITFQPLGFSGSAAVRYAVMTQADPVIEEIPAGSGFWYCVPQPPDLDNPWILYRMEGRMEPVGGRNVFGADYDEDGDGTYDYFVIGYWSSRNALTPDRGADIPVTRTICLDSDGYLLAPLVGDTDWAEGYVAPGDLDGNGTDDIEDVFGGAGVMLVYIHDGVTFGPLRVENERLADAGSGGTTTFSAEYGYWLGLPNPVPLGPYSVGEVTWDPSGVWPDFPMRIDSSELRPRIVVRRETSGDPWVMDTDDLYDLYPSGQPLVSAPDGAVIHNTYGTSWNSIQGTVTLASAAGPATIDFTIGAPPLEDEMWSSSVSDPSGGTIMGLPGSEVYDEDIRHTTLTAAPIFPYTTIDVTDASEFDEGDAIRIVDPDDPTFTFDDVTIAAGGIIGNTITFAPALGNSYIAGDWVRETGGPPPYYRRAYSSYWLAPYVEPAVDPLADKMVVPDSVRVWVTAWNDTNNDTIIDPGELASKEYRQVTSDPENIGPGQFAIEPTAPGNYRAITIHFGNGEDGGNGVRTPPPSPDDPSTFGGTSTGWDVGVLTDCRIEISYDVRRNFSTATGANDQIDVSYSTRAIYNVSLELLPWRYYADDDADYIWAPYQHVKGVHLQAQILIAGLGG